MRSEPPWAAKDLEAELELGKTRITFYATSPFSKEMASCSFTIHVRDTIPPRVYNCPTDFNVYLKDNEKEKEVSFIAKFINIYHEKNFLIVIATINVSTYYLFRCFGRSQYSLIM